MSKVVRMEFTIVEAVLTTGEQVFYWCQRPEGMSDEEAFNTQERHGPFNTKEEMAESQRLAIEAMGGELIGMRDAGERLQ